MGRKRLLVVILSIVATIMLTVIGGIIMNTVFGKMEPVEGLLVPTQKEAQYAHKLSNEDGAWHWIEPLNYDLRQAIEKGLATKVGGFSDKYLNMQALYRKALEQYLAEKLSLGMFDEMLETSELRFIPVPNNKQGFYQRYSTFDFKYIYLRNNLPIERLDLEDLDILSSHIEARRSDITEDLLEMVSGTFRRIIMGWENQEPEVLIWIMFDGVSLAPNNALVFIIGHRAEFDEDGNFVNRAGNVKKREYLAEEFIPFMTEKLSEEFGAPVVVYD
jgi:hypothetical protein